MEIDFWFWKSEYFFFLIFLFFLSYTPLNFVKIIKHDKETVLDFWITRARFVFYMYRNRKFGIFTKKTYDHQYGDKNHSSSYDNYEHQQLLSKNKQDTLLWLSRPKSQLRYCNDTVQGRNPYMIPFYCFPNFNLSLK